MDERFTYLVLTLGWALPPIFLQWAAGWRWLAQERRAWLLGVVIPTLYLSAADATALGVVWAITPAKSVGILVGNVPIEEIVFFLVTNTLVVQSFLLCKHARELTAFWHARLALAKRINE